MEIVDRIAVSSDIEAVWAFVSDLESVLMCLPGAQLGDPLDDGSYKARFVVSAGDFGISFGGVIRLNADAEGRTAVITAAGNDRARTISSEAKASLALAPASDGTTAIDIAATFDFSGFLAPAARAGAGPVARNLLERFSACLVSRFPA
jgi:carbon monoxide dehydrogenase subunit G